MNLLKKMKKKIKSGMLEEMAAELGFIYRYGMKYKWEILWYIFLGLFGTAMSLGGSVISKYIIDAVTGFKTGALAPAAVFYLLMQLLNIAARAWTSQINAAISIKVDQQIRADVYDQVMNADWETMSRYHSGDLLNRVDNDVAAVSGSVLGWIPDLITKLFQFTGTLGIILYYDATLAVLALISAPVTLILSRSMMGKMRRYNEQMRRISSEVMMFNEESFQNIQVIKSFGLTGLYSKKLRRVQEKYRTAKLDYNLFSVKASSLLSLAGTAVTVVCFGWGVYRLWTGHITYGTMTLFLQMAGSLSSSFSGLVSMVPRAVSAATAAGRIMAVTELPGEDHSDDERVERFLERNRRQGVTAAVENVTFRYENGEPVFRNASFEASPGEIVALVGPSGEGKTTMLRLMLGIVTPTEGKVLVRGKGDGSEINVSASTRRLFAYVPQGNTMFSGSVAENLRMMKQDASDEELYEVLRMACADEFIRRLPDGLNSRVLEQGGGFSQGQIQRLSIARALLADVPVLLLDEATSALDIATERQVLRNIVRSQNRRTCIVTTHRPSVLGICSRVYRIFDGQLEKVSEDEVGKMMMDF